MSLQLKLLAASGLEPPSPPAYRHLVSESADTGQMWKEVLTAVQVIVFDQPIHYTLLFFTKDTNKVYYVHCNFDRKRPSHAECIKADL